MYPPRGLPWGGIVSKFLAELILTSGKSSRSSTISCSTQMHFDMVAPKISFGVWVPLDSFDGAGARET